MYYKTYKQLVDYFEALPAAINGLNGATVGADEALLSEQPTQVLYPHLRVDTPTIRFVNDDQNSATRYTFRVFVLMHDPMATNDTANQILSDMATLAERVLRKIQTDASDDLFDLLTGDKDGDAVRAYSGDNLFGWFFTITIDLYTEVCP